MARKDGAQSTVRKRIFYSNALVVLVTIVVCAVIGGICVKIYWEREERALEVLLGGQMASEAAKELIENVTVHNYIFILMAVIFAALSVVTLVVVSRIFTVILSNRVMQPLELLEQGAQRIKTGDYSTPIIYEGDEEFEQVCDAFNGMQQHLKEEQERNARYEKARREMIAGISHDIRSPLTAIRGSVKAVLDGVVSEPEQQHRFLQAAYRRSGEMSALLDELFYFSKLETGGIPVQVQDVDLAKYLRSYFEARREQPDYADVEFVLDIAQQEPKPVQADPEALQRILDNILSNSRKYANASPLRFLVCLQEQEGCQRVILQDNGVGVPEDKLGRIFNEFYRVDESRGQKEGSGLGLYVVKYLCEAMGGHASADMESHHEGFAGLAVSLEFREGETKNG